MKRLTKKRDRQNVIPLKQNGETKWVICSAGMGDAPTEYLYGEHADRLAAYEDTGLEPCDYSAMAHALEQAERAREDLTEMIRQIGATGLDRLCTLAQADKEGKFPEYTIGDIIYDRFGMAWTVDSLEYVQCTYEKKWLYRCGHPETDDYRGLYQDEVLTRAEAADALRREQDG